jgi:hypothetical protein
MFTQPGKKLLFMGAELGQRSEWAHEGQLDWGLLDHDSHKGISRLVGDLNRIYREESPLHELDCEPGGFEWAVPNDSANSVVAYFRLGNDRSPVLVVHNMTPVPRHGYRSASPRPGHGMRSSIPTPRSTAVPARATSVASAPARSPYPTTADPIRSTSRCHHWQRSLSAIGIRIRQGCACRGGGGVNHG